MAVRIGSAIYGVLTLTFWWWVLATNVFSKLGNGSLDALPLAGGVFEIGGGLGVGMGIMWFVVFFTTLDSSASDFATAAEGPKTGSLMLAYLAAFIVSALYTVAIYGFAIVHASWWSLALSVLATMLAPGIYALLHSYKPRYFYLLA